MKTFKTHLEKYEEDMKSLRSWKPTQEEIVSNDLYLRKIQSEKDKAINNSTLKLRDKTPEPIWQELTGEKRYKFIEEKTGKQHTPSTLYELVLRNYRFLPLVVKSELVKLTL